MEEVFASLNDKLFTFEYKGTSIRCWQPRDSAIASQKKCGHTEECRFISLDGFIDICEKHEVPLKLIEDLIKFIVGRKLCFTLHHSGEIMATVDLIERFLYSHIERLDEDSFILEFIDELKYKFKTLYKTTLFVRSQWVPNRKMWKCLDTNCYIKPYVIDRIAKNARGVYRKGGLYEFETGFLVCGLYDIHKLDWI